MDQSEASRSIKLRKLTGSTVDTSSSRPNVNYIEEELRISDSSFSKSTIRVDDNKLT